MVYVFCPICDAQIDVAEGSDGMLIECPECGATLRVIEENGVVDVEEYIPEDEMDTSGEPNF